MWHSTILFAATEEGYKNISVLKHLEHHQFCAGFHSISGLVYLFMVTAIFCNSIAQTSHCTYAAPNEPEAITQMEYTLHPFEYHIHETDTLWGLNRTMICYNKEKHGWSRTHPEQTVLEQPLEVEEKFFSKHSWNNSFMWIGNIPNTKLPVIVLMQTSTSHSSGCLWHPWNRNYTFYPCEYDIRETDMHCSDTTNHQLLEPKWLICKHYWNNIVDITS